MFEKSHGVIFNKDLKRYKCKKFFANVFYVVACLLIMFAGVYMFVYALLGLAGAL